MLYILKLIFEFISIFKNLIFFSFIVYSFYWSTADLNTICINHFIDNDNNHIYIQNNLGENMYLTCNNNICTTEKFNITNYDNYKCFNNFNLSYYFFYIIIMIYPFVEII